MGFKSRLQRAIVLHRRESFSTDGILGEPLKLETKVVVEELLVPRHGRVVRRAGFKATMRSLPLALNHT